MAFPKNPKGIGAFVLVFLAAVFVAVDVAFSGSVKSQSVLTADDFFTTLTSNTVDIDHGEAVFVIRNPTASDIYVKASDLTARMQNYKGSSVDRYELFILGNMTVSQNVTDYNDWTWNETVTGANGTYNIPHYGRNVTGWHWDNFTRAEYKPVSDFAFKTGQTITVKLKGYWKPMLGEVSNEWFPRLNAGGTVFEQGKWAWWNTSWQYKRYVGVNWNGGSNQTNYQIKVDENITKCDMSERFTSLWENESMSYWIEANDSAGCHIWIKDAYGNDFWMYYGNTSAVASGSDYFATWNKTDTNYYSSDWESINRSVSATYNAGGVYDVTVAVDNDTSTLWWGGGASNGQTGYYWINLTSKIYVTNVSEYYNYGNFGQNTQWSASNDYSNINTNVCPTHIDWIGAAWYVGCNMTLNPSNTTFSFLKIYLSGLGGGYGQGMKEWNVSGFRRVNPEPTYFLGEQIGGEQAARSAIRQGVWDSLGQNVPLYYDQWVYSAVDGSTQSLVRFDIVTSNASKRWGFNFYNATEFNGGLGYNFSYNVTPSFYGLQMNYTEGLSASDMEYRVSKFINDTK